MKKSLRQLCLDAVESSSKPVDVQTVVGIVGKHVTESQAMRAQIRSLRDLRRRGYEVQLNGPRSKEVGRVGRRKVVQETLSQLLRDGLVVRVSPGVYRRKKR